MTWISFLVRHWRVFAVVLTILATVTAYKVVCWKCRQEERAQCKLETITKVVTIREKMNEARNHKPDNAALLELLHNGKF